MESIVEDFDWPVDVMEANEGLKDVVILEVRNSNGALFRPPIPLDTRSSPPGLKVSIGRFVPKEPGLQGTELELNLEKLVRFSNVPLVSTVDIFKIFSSRILICPCNSFTFTLC